MAAAESETAAAGFRPCLAAGDGAPDEEPPPAGQVTIRATTTASAMAAPIRASNWPAAPLLFAPMPVDGEAAMLTQY
jgi:hypothetical protein